MWQTMLDEEEMKRMSFGCTRRDGDLKSWRSMLSGLSGDVTINYDISSCGDITGLISS